MLDAFNRDSNRWCAATESTNQRGEIRRRRQKNLRRNEKRLIQKAIGIEATIVNGEVLVERGAHTGALPGMVLGNGNGSALQAAA